MNARDLIAFEAEVAEAFNDKRILAPVHLSGGNEDFLIEIFKDVHPGDWVFSTYRNHYHALLHGIPREQVMAQIINGHSMNLCFPEHLFYTSAIVGGILSIAVGAALAERRSGGTRKVWCFVGDMAASTGQFHEAVKYSEGFDLSIRFVVEDNSLSCDSPTDLCWGNTVEARARRYTYKRVWPHTNTGKWLTF